jgi:hypothetical protein
MSDEKSSNSSSGTSIIGAIVFLLVWYRLYLWFVPTHTFDFHKLDYLTLFLSFAAAIPVVGILWILAVLPLLALILGGVALWVGGKEAKEAIAKSRKGNGR